MDVSPNEDYLLLEYSLQTQKQFVKIFDNFPSALEKWEYLNRVSPIFPLKNKVFSEKTSESLFKGKSFLIFFGPINPAEIETEKFKKTKVWVTLGLYNIVVHTNSVSKGEGIFEWLYENEIRCEIWELFKNEIRSIRFSNSKNNSSSKRKDLQIDVHQKHYVIRSCVSEYLTLMSSFMARAEKSLPRIIDDVIAINNFVKVLTDSQNVTPNKTYEVFGFLTELNAGLSRFSSQTFSGISPILQTESHFWLHSLLGIGIPNLAVFKLREFIQKTIGDLRIPDLFELYKHVNDFSKLSTLASNNDYWYQYHITDNLKNEALLRIFNKMKEEPIMPLITYFSGREGFRSHHNALSIPLESVNSCNTSEWNLITITHEISHTIIRGILPSIYPDLNDPEDLKKCWLLSDPKSETKNLFEEIRKYLFLGIIYTEKSFQGKLQQNFWIKSEVEFRDILDKWHREVEELMAHIFDFLFFYGEIEKTYISQIWTSWSVIPNIRNRVREYVIRTLCALMSKNLRKGGDTEELSRTIFIDTLNELLTKNPHNSHYITLAKELLENPVHWADIKSNILARKNIIKIVRTFLYSKDFASKIFQEKWISVNKPSTDIFYDIKRRNISTQPISNPLVFLSQIANSTKPSFADSLWIYYIIAFNYND